MRRFIKRLSGVATIGLGAALVPLLGATPAAAAPGAQAPPVLTPSPVATASTNFSLSVPGGAFCDGTGGAGWRVETFIIENGTDVSTLAFDQGFPPNQVGDDRDATGDGVVRSPLWKGAAPGTTYNPAGAPAGLVNPSDLDGFNFSDPGWNLVDGPYQIGFVCKDASGAVAQWWSKTVTIDTTPGGGTSFMAEGAAAPAPTIDTVNVNNGQVIIDFTGTGADNFTAQASTVSGDFSSPVGTSTTAANDSSSITISGLTNGTPYFVRVLANKAGFSPSPSAQSGPHIPQTNGGAVQALTVTDSGTDDAGSGPYIDVDWNAPAAVSGCTVNSYTVGASPSGTATQPDPNPTGTGTGGSARVTGITTNQTVTITVTPVFAPGCTGTAASVSEFVATGNIVIQDIDVTRPIGALVLTQVCGSNGALPGEGDNAAGDPFDNTFNPPGDDTPGASATDLATPVIGFDRNGGLPPVAQVNPSTVIAPNHPAGGVPSLIVDPASGSASDQAAASDDPAYAAYPYPTNGSGVASPASETHCGLDLGVAEFVTQGAGAGQYFSADAAMNQVTIVDTRNVDQGWTVSGAMADFVASSETGAGDGPALDFFSGDFLGWTPVVTEDTPAFDNDADPGTVPYNQAAVAGPRVAPGTNLGLGDGSSEVLASAPAGSGLGTAILDARIKLLIPVTADAGLYEGSLTFSAV